MWHLEDSYFGSSSGRVLLRPDQNPVLVGNAKIKSSFGGACCFYQISFKMKPLNVLQKKQKGRKTSWANTFTCTPKWKEILFYSFSSKQTGLWDKKDQPAYGSETSVLLVFCSFFFRLFRPSVRWIRMNLWTDIAFISPWIQLSLATWTSPCEITKVQLPYYVTLWCFSKIEFYSLLWIYRRMSDTHTHILRNLSFPLQNPKKLLESIENHYLKVLSKIRKLNKPCVIFKGSNL